MEVIYKGKGQGKTTDIVKRVVECDGILLVPNISQYHHIKNNYPYIKDKVIVFDDRQVLVRHKPIFADNVDHILYHVIGHDLVGVSINKDTD